MTYTRPAERSARRVLRALATIAALAAAVGASCAATSVAHATSQGRLVAGKGAWLFGHADFVGYYRANVAGRWVKVYCVSPSRQAPGGVALRTVSRLRQGVTVTRELAETLSAHGNARTAAQAEAVSQALNEEIGNHRAVRRRASRLSKRARILARRYVAEARGRRGPYTLKVALPASALPGQIGTGTVALRSAAGGIAGTVTLRHTGNVMMRRTVRTNGSGHASFSYRTVGGGAVHVAASVAAAPVTLRANHPGRATQLMLTWSPRQTAHAIATYHGSGPRFGHRYECSSECDGHPLVTLTACAPASSYSSRLTFWYGERRHRIGFAAARNRVCTSWRVTLADGVSVSATWQYRTPRGWTDPLPAGGGFVVDCPAAPPVAVALGYDCARATLTAVLGTQADGTLTPLRNGSTRHMVLVIGGAISGRFDLAPGATARPHTYPVSCGTHATVTVRGGIQRRAGAYNYGRVATATTP